MGFLLDTSECWPFDQQVILLEGFDYLDGINALIWRHKLVIVFIYFLKAVENTAVITILRRQN